MNHYYVYIASNRSRTLYTGVTRDLERRLAEHKGRIADGFTKRYNVTWLVYWEEYTDVRYAIAREKEIKGWNRAKKVVLVNGFNPGWRDLSAGWRIPGAQIVALEIPRFARNDT